MQDNITILKYISIIQRNTGRYFDCMLEEDQIGSGQQFFILRIWEKEGMTMNELAQTGHFDKGTVTKAVKKLHGQGYIKIETDEKDRRVRHLYTTEKAEKLIDKIYRIRDRWKDEIMKGLSPSEADRLLLQLKNIAETSCASIDRYSRGKGEEKHGGK